MITKDKLEMYAKKLMFGMNYEEYKTLEDEFEVILKQMEFIDNIKDIDKVDSENLCRRAMEIYGFPAQAAMVVEECSYQIWNIQVGTGPG